MKSADDIQRAQERASLVQRLHREEEEERAKEKAGAAGVAYANYRLGYADPLTLMLLDETAARKHNVAVAERTRDRLTLAALDPADAAVQEISATLKTTTGIPVAVVGVSSTSLEHLWNGYRKHAHSDQQSGEATLRGDVIASTREEIHAVGDVSPLLQQHQATSVTALIEVIFGAALALRASDIHFEQAKAELHLRYRIDGVLHDIGSLPSDLYQRLLSRIKLLSQMKLNVRDIPQDGRFTLSIEEKTVEIRSAVAPSQYGEDIVLRILDPSVIRLSLGELGLRDQALAIVRDAIREPDGLILTTGPTGSGKTTTLYAFLQSRNDPGIKIITIEDPIEYHLTGIEQTETNPEKGMTFFAGLTSALRRDPDVILVGEIRDPDTAHAAIQAALTGHLVFSTLHTNDAAGAIPRLIDLGVQSSLIPSALAMVMAQRLVRRLCQECAISEKPDAGLRARLKKALKGIPDTLPVPDIDRAELNHPPQTESSCVVCGGFGYKGRIGIYEIFRVDEAMEALITKKPSIVEARAAAIERGMVPMKQDAIVRMLEGITSLEEVERVFGPL